ncbi:hypothetical protein CFR78_13105 [Komagataeibacter rhaeticus]|uniref:Uncharacterized protein n=1 Tax=Komagataeibacter rhaeticus TaxID=215221 RepID=A0A181CDZ9_9PROT|nr:hypothetical protein [Komagataeibacter rhaeticus]ATU71568.1 hypothetical protein CT154_00635 [Komagataeibacter xylinus]KDU96516.1 hypothetical protein GLUCORHAEAF1_01450 [Komagataeibacter rhaeticus AF1]MBL7239748.1 hypothetical protein [Komagataeibacter rhaeticus]PYD52743.1 hypothetical protein CFR78_13105 [Komagataeibacter rhaeticus]QIP36376.1 hypothetical protein GWK63_13590 [Komagataeibacter rhaeticus]
MTRMLTPALPATRSPFTHHTLARVKTLMREMWIVPMVVMGSLLCGSGFTLLSRLLGHAG